MSVIIEMNCIVLVREVFANTSDSLKNVHMCVIILLGVKLTVEVSVFSNMRLWFGSMLVHTVKE